jgi:hypothetical protein
LNKKSKLFFYLHVLEQLDDDISNNENVQEDVKGSPEINIKLTIHTNKLCACFKESDGKVNVVAYERSEIKYVAYILDVGGETFNRKLNIFIIRLKQLPEFSNNAQANNSVM